MTTYCLWASRSILGQTPTDGARSQAFLPIQMGGAGLMSTAQISAASYIASVKQATPVVRSVLPPTSNLLLPDTAFHLLQRHTGNHTYTSLDLLPPSSTQHSLSTEIHSHQRSQLLSSSSARDRARLHSLALPHAGTGSTHSHLSISPWTLGPLG